MRRVRLTLVLLAGLIGLGVSEPAWVHHSGAMFDRSRVVTFSGTVREFLWMNPHSSFKVDVTDAEGKVETWAIEMNGPSNLIREGWKRSTLRPGDRVTVTVNPLRDGRPGGWYVGVMLADGRSLSSKDVPAGGTSPGGDQ